MKKTFVSKINCVLKKNNGFTVLEMMLSMLILIVIGTLFPLIIMHLNHYKATASSSNDINFELAMQELIIELKTLDQIIVTNQLYGTKNSKTYSYKYSNGRLVRQIDFEGYTILLEQVSSASFFEIDDQIYIRISYAANRGDRDEVIQIK